MNLFTLYMAMKNGISPRHDPQKNKLFTPLLIRMSKRRKHCNSSHTTNCQAKTNSERRSYSLSHGTTSLPKTIYSMPMTHQRPPDQRDPHRCSVVICCSIRLATCAPDISRDCFLFCCAPPAPAGGMMSFSFCFYSKQLRSICCIVRFSYYYLSYLHCDISSSPLRFPLSSLFFAIEFRLIEIVIKSKTTSEM